MSAHASAGEARPRIPLPTLLTVGIASVVLVVAVGLQAPALSGGLRWKPAPGPGIILDVEPAGRIFLGPGGPGELTSLWWVGWLLGGLVALLILAWIVRWLRRFIRPGRTITLAATGADAGATARPNERVVRSGLATALDLLNSGREPGNAVVRAWQGLEDAAAAAGLERRPSETTSEFTARILYRSRASAEPIRVLQSLYHRVRFGHRSPDADEIAAARASLAALVDLWQQDLPGQRRQLP